MQNTRLDRLFNVINERLTLWLRNPWRRISLLIISILFGNFLATVISTIAGQEGYLDVTYAIICLLITEFLSWLAYRSYSRLSPSFLRDCLNGFKIGLTYGLFLEAFKLGS